MDLFNKITLVGDDTDFLPTRRGTYLTWGWVTHRDLDWDKDEERHLEYMDRYFEPDHEGYEDSWLENVLWWLKPISEGDILQAHLLPGDRDFYLQ